MKDEPGFLLTGYALFGGLGLWVVHLVGSASLVAAACTHDLSWVINLLTAVTAVGTAGSIAAGVALHRNADRWSVNVERTRLLGELSIIFGIATLALILVEGYPVVVLDACRT